jgi:hypothetical protein
LIHGWKTAAKVLFVGALVIPLAACGVSRSSGSAGSNLVVESDSFEDSGRRLSGEFVLSHIEDLYRPESSPTAVQTFFSFDEAGSFKRQQNSRVDEGVYLISAKRELVLYVEKINGQPLTEAKVERFVIIEEGADSIALGSGPSRKLMLKNR